MELVIRGIVPLSYNAHHKAKFQKLIQSAFNRKFRGAVPQFPADTDLYAKVYFFTNSGVNVDADNISKPIWDAVNGIVYVDDRRIVMRTAAVIDLNSYPCNMIDTSRISGDVASDLLQGIMDNDVKCIFIECGEFMESMIKIGSGIL